MKWLRNLENLVTNHKVGECPFCNSKDTKFKAEKTQGNMGYLVMWCENCKHVYNISRVKITRDIITDNQIPKDLIF